MLTDLQGFSCYAIRKGDQGQIINPGCKVEQEREDAKKSVQAVMNAVAAVFKRAENLEDFGMLDRLT